MATVNKVFRSVLGKHVLVNSASALYKCVNIVNAYSMYGPQFVEPIYKKEQQESMYESGEVENILHVPVKAARVDATCSVFHDDLVRKFTNHVMKDGNKVLARELVEKAFQKIKRIQLQRYHGADDSEKKASIETNPLKIFHMALTNTKPVLQLTPIKRGGVTYQVGCYRNNNGGTLDFQLTGVPVPITDNRARFMAMKWLILAARDKDLRVHFPEKLAWELVDAAANQGKVVKKKQDLHRQCEANRAYAHYRWS